MDLRPDPYKAIWICNDDLSFWGDLLRPVAACGGGGGPFCPARPQRDRRHATQSLSPAHWHTINSRDLILIGIKDQNSFWDAVWGGTNRHWLSSGRIRKWKLSSSKRHLMPKLILTTGTVFFLFDTKWSFTVIKISSLIWYKSCEFVNQYWANQYE